MLGKMWEKGGGGGCVQVGDYDMELGAMSWDRTSLVGSNLEFSREYTYFLVLYFIYLFIYLIFVLEKKIGGLELMWWFCFQVLFFVVRVLERMRRG